MNFDIGLHTVIFLVGPSQCGKSTWSAFFSNKVKELDDRLRCAVVSSDKSRQYILGNDFDRNDKRMLSVSEQAFAFVKYQVQALTSFPANNEFVIVDTMGFDENFRKDLMDTAKSNGYNTAVVLFDYEYKEYLDGAVNKTLVARQVENFKKNIMPKLGRKDFDFNFKVKQKNTDFFKDSTVSIVSLDLWKKTQIHLTQNIVVVGDIHEDVEALSDLVSKFSTHQDKSFILLGDYLDKGERTLETIDYVYDWFKKGNVKIIVGNHESFVYRRLKGLVSAVDNEAKNFSSLSSLMGSPEAQEKFFYLFENSLPFVYLFNENVHAYLTHAPCKNKYLGKMSDFAQKSQRNFYFKNRDHKEMNKELEFMFKEANRVHPYHIFGHVAHSMKNFVISNKVWLDTGSVYGGKLSAMEIKTNGKYNLTGVAGRGKCSGELIAISSPDSVVVQDDDVLEDNNDEAEESLVLAAKSTASDIGDDFVHSLVKKFNLNNWQTRQMLDFKDLASEGVCFVSGTMTPSKSYNLKFEPVESALRYFKDNGVKNVFIAPKFMGSRGQVYLFKDKPTIVISRSGQRVNVTEELNVVLDSLKAKCNHLFKDVMVLDGEILPWSYMGKDLIDLEFKAYGASISCVADTLNNDAVWQSFDEKNKPFAQNFVNQSAVFKEQMDLYAQKGEVSFRVFDILKIDDLLNPWSFEQTFKFFNPDLDSLTISLDSENYIDLAQAYFDSMTNKGSENSEFKYAFEGVVVKPLNFQPEIINAIKVRNENYLHIIYGHDYKDRYESLCKSKSVKFKSELAKLHQDLGQRMLLEKSLKSMLESYANILYQDKINKKYSQIDASL